METHRTPELRFLHRLHCVLFVAQGYSCYQVANWFEGHPCTVERWIHCFEQNGVEGLREKQKTGRPAKVDVKQSQQLKNDILKDPRQLGYDQNGWNGKLLQIHILRCCDVELSIRQCQRLLRQLHSGTSNHAALVL
jgi:transposase